MNKKLYGIGLVILSSIVSINAAVLINPGFETGDFTGWSTFGQGWRIGGGADANSGTSGAVNDVLTSDVDNFRGIFQNVAVEEGMTYLAGVYIRAVNIESSQSWFELQWLDAGAGVISQLQSDFVTDDQGYTFMSIGNVTAPSGAVSASIRGIVNMLSAPTVGTDFQTFDDFEFAAVPEPNVLSLTLVGILGIYAKRRKSSELG